MQGNVGMIVFDMRQRLRNDWKHQPCMAPISAIRISEVSYYEGIGTSRSNLMRPANCSDKGWLNVA